MSKNQSLNNRREALHAASLTAANGTNPGTILESAEAFLAWLEERTDVPSGDTAEGTASPGFEGDVTVDQIIELVRTAGLPVSTTNTLVEQAGSLRGNRSSGVVKHAALDALGRREAIDLIGSAATVTLASRIRSLR